MKVIILAAGQGERLKPLTAKIPKALLKFRKFTLLDWHLMSLKKAGFTDVSLVVGFGKEEIYKIIWRRNPGLPVTLITNELYETTGNSYSLWLGLRDVDDDILFMDADILYDRSIFNYIDREDERNVLLTGKTHIDDESVKVFQENGLLTELGKNVDSGGECAGEAVGILKFSRAGRRVLRETLQREIDGGNMNRDWEMTIHSIAGTLPIHVVDIHDTQWIEIDFIQDYKKAQELFKEIY